MKHFLIKKATEQLKEKEFLCRALKYSIRSASREQRGEDEKVLRGMYKTALADIAHHQHHLHLVKALIYILNQRGLALTGACYDCTCEHVVCELLRSVTIHTFSTQIAHK